MAKVYLRYRMTTSPDITICASYVSLKPSRARITVSEDVFDTQKTPTEILKEFRKFIRGKIEGPSFIDILQGMFDQKEEYKDYERYLGWLPSVPFSTRGDPTYSQKKERFNEENRTLHDRLFPLYQEFVQKYSENQ